MSLDIRQGDCREVMAAMEPGSVDAIVTDPPYGLEFMGKEWDRGVPSVPFWAEALRLAKPGAHLLAFGGTRTYHRPTCAIEDAGWDIRDCLMWLYGSGFPKSLDVSKAIDKGHRRDEAGKDYTWSPSAGPTEDVYAVTAFVRAGRDRAGVTNKAIDALFGFHGMSGHWTSSASQPAVPTWPQWVELKSLLHLSDEMDALVEKINGGKGDRSLEGTAFAERDVLGVRRGKDAVAGDVYRPGDGTYIAKDFEITTPATGAARHWAGWGTALKPAWEPIILARKPVAGTVAGNVLTHGTGAMNVDGCRINTGGEVIDPVFDGRKGPEHGGKYGNSGDYLSNVSPLGRWPANVLLDEEAAAQLDDQAGEKGGGFGTSGGDPSGHGRYGSGFPRGDGRVVGFGDSGGPSRFFYTAKASSGERHYAGRNAHPTVKPVDLMRWLCRLVTPPGGLVLDPFCGSGSTGVAALAECFRFIGIEQDQQWVEVARKRIAGPLFAEAQP